MIEIKELPQDFLVPIEDNHYLLGRITIAKYQEQFTTEIVLVQKESKKIYKHLKSLYNFDDPQEAVDQSLYYLSQYLKSLCSE